VLDYQQRAHTNTELSRWKPGESGNPAGRPEGARQKLSTEYFNNLYEAWLVNGKAALQTAAWTDPVQFVKTVASHMPRDVQATITQIHHLERVSDQKLLEIISGEGSEEEISDPQIVQPMVKN
jgi:hypothetical protein